jgi:endo-1,4-beta-D-glucanase Y
MDPARMPDEVVDYTSASDHDIYIAASIIERGMRQRW